MERFRHAAAHMSTIYYRKLPWTSTSDPALTDIEKQPVTKEIGNPEQTSNSESAAKHLEPSNHVFAWQDLTLELGNGRRLLENVSGIVVGFVQSLEHFTDESTQGGFSQAQ